MDFPSRITTQPTTGTWPNSTSRSLRSCIREARRLWVVRWRRTLPTITGISILIPHAALSLHKGIAFGPSGGADPHGHPLQQGPCFSGAHPERKRAGWTTLTATVGRWTSDDDTLGKVDRLRNYMAAFDTSDAVYIGRLGGDVEAAKANGLYVIGVLYGDGDPELVRRAGPDAVAPPRRRRF